MFAFSVSLVTCMRKRVRTRTHTHTLSCFSLQSGENQAAAYASQSLWNQGFCSPPPSPFLCDSSSPGHWPPASRLGQGWDLELLSEFGCLSVANSSQNPVCPIWRATAVVFSYLWKLLLWSCGMRELRSSRSITPCPRWGCWGPQWKGVAKVANHKCHGGFFWPQQHSSHRSELGATSRALPCVPKWSHLEHVGGKESTWMGQGVCMSTT